MATSNERHGKLDLSSISANWSYKDSKPDNWSAEPSLCSIMFVPGAADDKLVIKEEDADGPIIFEVTCNNIYDTRVKYWHGTRAIPFIDYSLCTFSTGHRVTIELWRE